MQVNELIGMRIRAAREARGWDQADLAIRADVDASSVSRWEAGKAALTAEQLARLAAVLGVRCGELLP